MNSDVVHRKCKIVNDWCDIEKGDLTICNECMRIHGFKMQLL
jgi:hypothetical protein